MEPAAMLVGAFEVQVGRPGQAARLQHEGVGRAALEPHVDDVHHLLVVCGIAAVAEEARRRRGIPGIRAFGGERLDDAGHHGRVAQRLAGAAFDEHRDRHAPGALAADAPVRAGGDHAARCGCGRQVGHEIGVADRGERLAANVLLGPSMRMNHCGVARKISGALGTPGMRVGMHELAAREQRLPPRSARRRSARPPCRHGCRRTAAPRR